MAVKKPAARRPMTPIPRQAHARVFIKTEKCKGCRFCVEFCPTRSLQLSTQFNAKGYHYPIVAKDECINCSLCTLICPDYAIFSLPAGSVERIARTDTNTGLSDKLPPRLTPPPLAPALRQQRAAAGSCDSRCVVDGKHDSAATLTTFAAVMVSGERIVR